MNNYKFSIDLIILLAVVNDAGHSLVIGKGLPKSFNSTSNNNSHEELHTKIDSSTSAHPNYNSVNVTNHQTKQQPTVTSVLPHQLVSKMSTKSDSHVNSMSTTTLTPKHENIIFAEGGEIVSSELPLVNKPNATNSNVSIKLVTPHPSINSKVDDSSMNLTTGVNSSQLHKRIHGRPGVSEIVTLPVAANKFNSTSRTTLRPRKKKPLFTMITGDKETKDSESFIESSTTGRDYVLPIVLIILSLPIVGYLIKIIYKRGTEFTERQQYHRMYLIDGMYNSR